MIEYIFRICLDIKLNDHHYLKNRCFVSATLHSYHVISASDNEVVLYLAMTQRHANEGAQ